MAIASRKFVFTMMDEGMLLITHVYQPIVAPSHASGWILSSKGYLAPNHGL